MRPPTAVLLPALLLLLVGLACDSGGPGATATLTGTETPQVALTPSPSKGEAQPVVIPPDLVEFLAQFSDVVIMQETCGYDRDSGLVDCGTRGLYQLQDGAQAADAVCRVMLVDDRPLGINCQTQDPPGSIIYAIQPSPTASPSR